MSEPRNRIVRVGHYGGPDGLEVVDAPMPTPGAGEVRVRVLASSLEYTDVVIRRHLYPQIAAPAAVRARLRRRWRDRSGGRRRHGAAHRRSRRRHDGRRLERALPHPARGRRRTRAAGGRPGGSRHGHPQLDDGVPAPAPRGARAAGQRVLVHGAAGAVGQALLALGRLAGLEVWGAARGEHAASLIRELGATPIDYRREDFTRVLPGRLRRRLRRHRRGRLPALVRRRCAAAGCCAPTATRPRCRPDGSMAAIWPVDRAAVPVEPGGPSGRTRALLLDQRDARAASRLVQGGSRRDCSPCSPPARSTRASPSASRSTRVADAHRRVEAGASTASSCCAP